MALNSSGQISLNSGTSGESVALELGLTAGVTLDMLDSRIRTLIGKPTGAISMPTDFYGKSSNFSGTITTNQTNFNLRTWALANGWNATLPATITLNSSVYIYSTATGTPALTIDGAWPGGVTFVNNGFVMGMGGVGGEFTVGKYGGAGGNAISLGVACSIVNNSYIGGGGGGGRNGTFTGGGGGAGGGVGGTSAGATPDPGGTGGAIGTAGGRGGIMCGGGGGRIMPGTGGAGGPGNSDYQTAGGYGGGSGGGGSGSMADFGNWTGGAGGSASATGGAATGQQAAGGGGGWGASGGSSIQGAAAAGGKGIALNGFTVTRTGSGTTYGAVS
jgi:hypothetical protein